MGKTALGFAKILKVTIVPFLLLLAFFLFYKPIVNAGLGAAARWVLASKLNCKCAYRSVEWERNRIVFSDIVLFDAGGGKSAFHSHIEKASLQFDWREFPKRCKGHLSIDRPLLILSQTTHWPEWKGGKNWFDLTISLREGVIDIPGMDKARFSYDRSSPDQIGRLKLEWGTSGLYLEGFSEGRETTIDAEFKLLEMTRLQAFLKFGGMEWDGEFKEGKLDGWLHFALEDGKWKRSSSHLELNRVSFYSPRCSLKGIDGIFDWDGSIGVKKGLLGDFLPCRSNENEEGRIRVSLTRMGVETALANIEGVKGDLTYNSGMGAKWEIQGTGSANGSQFPISWRGRGFLHSQRANWIESELHLGDAVLLNEGREEESRRTWTADVRSLQAEHATLLQAFASAFLDQPELNSWNFATGILNGEGNLSLTDKAQIASWNLPHFEVENLSVKKGNALFCCGKAEGHFSADGGECSLSCGEIRIPLPGKKDLHGKGWEGKCVWEKNTLSPSYFSGWFETERGNKIQAGLKADGKWNQWNLEADLGGFLAGRLIFRGGWEEDKWGILIEPSEIEGMVFNGKGWVDPNFSYFLSAEKFQGKLDWLGKIWEGSFNGRIESIEKGLQVAGDRQECDWSFQAKVEKGAAASQLLPNCRIENAKMEIDASSDEISFFKMEGEWVHKQGILHFSCPLLSRKKQDWLFDIRFDSGPCDTWDILRLCGKSDGKELIFDEKKSHLLGSALNFTGCSWKEGKFDVQWTVPWNAVLSAGPCLQKWGISSFNRLPVSGAADVHFHYCNEGGSELFVQGVDFRWKGQPAALDWHVLQQKGEWNIDRFLLADFSMHCLIRKEEDKIKIDKGGGSWKNGLAAEFEGKITSDFHCELVLPHVKIDLSQIGSLTDSFGLSMKKMEGTLEGQGRLNYRGEFESDFDLNPSSLKAGPFALENKGPIHLYFSSEKGVFFRGLDLCILKPDGLDPSGLSWMDCKIDLLQYDTASSHWILNHSDIRLRASLLNELHRRPPFLRFLDEKQDLDFIAEIDCASDFSNFLCSMKEGTIPIAGTALQVKDLHLFWNENGCSADFQTLHKGHLLSIGFDMNFEPKIGGYLTLKEEGICLAEDERPLKIDWEYSEKGLSIQSIDGAFSGIDASFHAEINSLTNTLIGSARLDFNALSQFIPPKIAEVFQELKMGKGYELKGRLKFENQKAFFNGILSGKQLDLFGYQFRTLLGRVDLRPDFVGIYDLKISDSAGIMKIEQIVLEEKPGADWTLSIPQLAILELRPCLLQKPGKEPGPLSPLVVREIKITDFKGILDDSKTYTAKGDLHFINSYKRDYTVFDLPADVLSRIVGLDLELLIPVMGRLNFELKDRQFHLTELTDSFSESRRSEFFLEKGEQEPYMDLDGNLKILVKMKQFVLFKFTEAFLISIDGTLSDPQYRLQKKRRFFGM